MCSEENATKEYLKWIMPSIRHRTVSKEKNCFRIEKASEQLEIGKRKGITANAESIREHKNEIVEYVNEFLTSVMSMDAIPDPFVEPKGRENRRIKYCNINPENKENIVWIKFTTNGLVSVIGTGCDIFFTDKTRQETSAGIINEVLGLEWDESVVLIFPLRNIPEGLNRSDIESGIGNYLIHKGVPILDFYSHNY